MSSDLADAYDFPRGFDLHRADHLERVEADDGTAFRVLISATDGPQLVHADVVEYEGWLDHPATTGVIGFLGVLAGLLVPIVGGYLVASGAESGLVTIGGALGGIVGGWAFSNVLMSRTVVGDWLFRFLEWNDHKHTIMVRGEAV